MIGFYNSIGRFFLRYLLAALLLFFPISAVFSQDGLVPNDKGAGLLITPTRLILEGKNRSAVVILTNNGSTKGTYKISLINKRMSDDGKIEVVEEAIKGEKFADSFLRISPRRITLAPGEYQNVRILARKPRDLAKGEYRSHLLFTLIPEADDARPPELPGEDEVSIVVKARFGVSIPVIVRNGELVATTSIGAIKLKDNAETGKKHVIFDIQRQGDASLYGDITISYLKQNGQEIVLKYMGGMAIYAPNSVRKFDVPVEIPKGVKLDKGHIEIVYQEKEKDGGRIIARKKAGL